MLQEISGFVGVVIWPIVVLFVVILFRRPLKGLMSGDEFSVKAPGGFELTARRRGEAVAALTEAAVAKEPGPVDPSVTAHQVDDAALTLQRLGARQQVLWVDDRPSNNRSEQTAMEALGIDVELSGSTDDALDRVGRGRRYDLVISDMARPDDPKAGYTLLAKLRATGNHTPYIIYAGAGGPEYFDEAVRRGADGYTNRPQELFDLVLKALGRRHDS